MAQRDRKDREVAENPNLAAEAAAGFARLIELMTPIRDGGLALAQKLGTMAAVDAQEAIDFAELARETRLAFAPMADRSAAADRESQARIARNALMNLRQRGVALNAVASMTHITARSFNLASFDAYVLELRRISSELAPSSEIVLAAIDRVVHHDAAGVASAAAAIDALDSLLSQTEITAGFAGSAGDCEDLRAAEALSGAAEGLRDRLNQELDGLVPIMQFADEFAQRIEHIERIGKSGRLGPLQAAQFEALAEDTEQRLRDARTRMEALAGLSDRAAGHFERSGAAGQRSVRADEHRAGLDGAVREAAAVERAAATAREGFDVLDLALREAEGAFQQLERHASNIGYAAINSVLLSKGHGQASAALSTLAAAVSEQSRETVTDLTICRDALAATVARDEAIGIRIAETAAALSFTLERARERLKDEDEAAVGRAATTDAARATAESLSAALARAIAAIGSLVACPHTLREQAVAARGIGVALDPDTADAVFPIYTMQRERDVHNMALGRDVPVATATAARRQQDTADALV